MAYKAFAGLKSSAVRRLPDLSARGTASKERKRRRGGLRSCVRWYFFHGSTPGTHELPETIYRVPEILITQFPHFGAPQALIASPL